MTFPISQNGKVKKDVTHANLDSFSIVKKCNEILIVDRTNTFSIYKMFMKCCALSQINIECEK